MANEFRLINANAMRQDWLENGLNEYVYDTNAVLYSIDNQPTIDTESLRPKGRWVMKETMIRGLFAKNAYCSECLWETAQDYNFCPNCGAKMEA